MAAIKVDFTNVESFEPVPAGAYVVVVSAMELTESGANSKNPGTPMLKTTFEIREPEAFASRKLFSNSMLSGPGLFSTQNLLRAIDPENAEMYTQAIEFDPDEMIGRACELDVKVKPHYNDPTRESNEIKGYYPLQ